MVLEYGYLETAGALGAGERVWVMARLKDDVDIAKDDAIQRYILLTTGHDGRTAVQFGSRPSESSAKTRSHVARDRLGLRQGVSRAGMKDVLQDAQLGIQAILTSFKELEVNFRRMVGFKLDRQSLEEYLGDVFPDHRVERTRATVVSKSNWQKVEQTRTHAKRSMTPGKETLHNQ